jgi:hypothetical protein
MRTGPEASEQHHRAILPASALLSPAQMSCPRGESPLTHMSAITGEFVLGGQR